MTASNARGISRILVIKTHAIGDLLMTTPAIRDLRAAYPRAHISLMAGKWSAPALRKNPHLDEIIEFDDRILLRWRPLGALSLLLDIRRREFDVAIIFHPSPLIHAFAWLAGIPVRYGLTRGGESQHERHARFLTQGVPEDLQPNTYYPINFQRVTALAGATPGPAQLEVHPDAGDKAEANRLLAESGIGDGDSFLLVAPGGGRNSKEDVAARRWPAERFAELAQHAIATHPGLKVVVTGAASDAREAGIVSSKVPGSINLTARTTLGQLYVLTRRARAGLCNDSSLLHIAVACRKPVVAPFGPTAAAQRLPEWARRYSIQSGIPCSPCYIGGRFPGCPIRFECLREMTAGTLHAGLERALADG
jgi:heptosyltransferase-2